MSDSEGSSPPKSTKGLKLVLKLKKQDDVEKVQWTITPKEERALSPSPYDEGSNGETSPSVPDKSSLKIKINTRELGLQGRPERDNKVRIPRKVVEPNQPDESIVMTPRKRKPVSSPDFIIESPIVKRQNQNDEDSSEPLSPIAGGNHIIALFVTCIV
jgi:hypothetical protein